ncbi:MAG: fasciclin domain-containing protein, partial [Maribacter sp.]
MLFLALFITILSCDKDDDTTVTEKSSEMTITATAQDNDALTSLVAALTQANAGLVEALDDDDATFTVFAPTDAAFTALLETLAPLGYGSLDKFQSDAEKEVLATILQYHVVSGTAAKSTDLSDEQMIATLQGE